MAKQTQSEEIVYVARRPVTVEGVEHPAGTELARVRFNAAIGADRAIASLYNGLAQPKDEFDREREQAQRSAAGAAPAEQGGESGGAGEPGAGAGEQAEG